jgi:hypothetical protein
MMTRMIVTGVLTAAVGLGAGHAAHAWLAETAAAQAQPQQQTQPQQDQQDQQQQPPRQAQPGQQQQPGQPGQQQPPPQQPPQQPPPQQQPQTQPDQQQPQAQPGQQQRQPAGQRQQQTRQAEGQRAQPAAVGTSLGTVRINRSVTANGQPLRAGTYQVRIGEGDVKPAPGLEQNLSQWVEFVQGGQVRGREVASVVPQGEIGQIAQVTPPRSGGSRVEMLRGNDYLRVWLNRGGTHYLIHLPPAS